MEYITEFAEEWGVTPGRIQRFVPAGAERSGDPRFLAADIAYVNTFFHALAPRDNPDSILDAVPKRVRVLPEMELAYFRGGFERIKRLYLAIDGDDALKLSASQGALASAVNMGDYSFFLEIENWLKKFIKANISDEANAIAECALAASYLGASAPNMVPDWLKSGDFIGLPGIPNLTCVRVKYFQVTGQYESVLAAAQTALAFCASGREMNTATIYLSALKAVACCHLNRLDEAEACLLDLLRSCLPHGFITPFVELAALFGGLLERCLEREFPRYYDVIVKGWQSSFKNRMAFHNQFTKDNITFMLSLREYQIAQLVTQGVPYREIAARFYVSEGRMRNMIKAIQAKLFVNNKTELAKFIL